MGGSAALAGRRRAARFWPWRAKRRAFPRAAVDVLGACCAAGKHSSETIAGRAEKVQGDFGDDAKSARVAKVGVEEDAEKQGSDGDDAADAAAVGAGAGTKLGAGEGKESEGGVGGKELAVALCAPEGYSRWGEGGAA